MIKKNIYHLIFFKFILFVVIHINTSLYAQQDYGVLVFDTKLSVQDSFSILIPGNLVDTIGNGQIWIDGEIEVRGQIINDASNHMFFTYQTIPQGILTLRSYIHTQNVSGQGQSIHFPNLQIIGTKKMLFLNDCQTNNKLIIDSELDLNRKNFIINNSNSDAIIYNSGFIRSESQPPIYGTIQWNIKNNTGTFLVPFGNGAMYEDNLKLSLIIETSGSADGSYTMATYPTDNFTNTPFPPSVLSLLPYQDVNMVDRFWYVSPNFVSRPNISLGFTYYPPEIDPPNSINRRKLDAIRYNDFQFKWNDWKPGSIINETTGCVLTNSIPRQHQFSHWTLVSEDVTGDIWIPNAFTPDRDEYYKNEDFGPIITFPYAKYEFYIYNRWGQLVFQSEDVNIRWDGTFQGDVVTEGTYAWLIVITKHSTKKYKYNGIVNVVL